MKILMLTSSFAPLTGGAESYMRNLARGMAAEGHDVTVATDGSWLPDEPADSMLEGFRLIRLSRFAEELDRLDRVRWRQLQYCVMDELGRTLPADFDLVHANSHETLLLGAHVSLTLDCPLVASLHEVTPNQDSPYGVGRLALTYRVLPVDAIIAGSRFYRDRGLENGAPADRLHHVYNSVPLPELNEAGRELGRKQLDLPPDAPVVVYPARIHPRKDQLTLVEAFARLRRTFPAAVLVLAGRVSDFGYGRQVHDAVAGNGSSGAVVFASDLADEDMGPLYQAADVVTLPSLQEGLGLAAVEAMSYARPVVVTDVDGLREVVTHDQDGLLVPPSDPAALADALARVLREPHTAHRLALAGRSTAESRFSQQGMVARTLQVYAAAAEQHATRSNPAGTAEGGSR